MAVKTVLVDSSFLLAMVDRDDKHHPEAVGVLRELGKVTLLVTSHIFDEAMTLIKVRLGSEVAIRTGRQLRLSTLFRLTHVTEGDDEAAWEIFSQYTDKDWSYTDCSCLAMMRKLGITEVLSFGHHFDQMGIVRLP
jgi:predicted nucleic acid-binding protein